MAMRRCVATLLAAGASSEAANRAGVVPLRAATARGHHDAVRALLDAGATADAVDDKTGVTPLMEACYNDDVPMARLLAAAGADSGRRAANGLCAMEMASERMREALADVDRPRREQAHTQAGGGSRSWGMMWRPHNRLRVCSENRRRR